LIVTTRKNRHETWWEQTEWALGKYVNDGGSKVDRRVAANAINFLVRSPLATKHEADFLSVVMAKETFERRQPETGAFDPTAVASDAAPVDNEISTEEVP
jgi:hypothetical protein